MNRFGGYWVDTARIKAVPFLKLDLYITLKKLIQQGNFLSCYLLIVFHMYFL